MGSPSGGSGPAGRTRSDDGADLASQPYEAARQARDRLAASPADAHARLLLAAALRRTGDAAGARVELAALAQVEPSAWGVHVELGCALAMLGDAVGAVAALRRAVSLNPSAGLAWHALGDQLTILGDDAAAARAHGEMAAGGVHDLLLAQAVRDRLDGREGPASLERRFNLHRSDPLAASLVADVGLRLGRYEAVAKLAKDHLARAPAVAPLRRCLALALHRSGETVRGAAEARRLCAQHPKTPAYRLLEAALRVELSGYDRALAIYAALLEDRPADAAAWLAYGHVLRILGRQADSVAAYRRSLALAPGSGEAYWSLANLKQVRFSPDEIAAMADRLGPAGPDPRSTPAQDRAALHYAYAKAMEDDGRFAEAFSHYQQGASLRRASAPWDAVAHHDYVRRARRAFTPAFLAERQAVGVRSPGPIFIVGLPRSGSTLVEQILASHPEVEGLSERPTLTTLARRLARTAASGGGARGYPELLRTTDAETFSALGEAYLAGVRPHRRLGRPRFTDKFPGNVLQIGLILLALPEARIIDVRRHPMACCVSLFKQYFAEGQHYSYALDDLGRYYADYVDLTAHFDAVAPGRVLRVHYEDLVADLAGETRRLLDHCGLAFDPACLDFHQTRRPVRTASSEQVRRPIFAEGLDHWRNFAPWLAPLEAALGPERRGYRLVGAAAG